MSLKLPRKVIRSNLYNDCSSSLLMGSNFSQNKESSYTSNSEYGRTLVEKHRLEMGSGASSQRESTIHQRNRGSSLSDGALNPNHFRNRNLRCGSQQFGSSPQIPRPLPHGPGPLLPNNNSLKLNRKRQELIPTKAKGPVKASHEINQKNSSSSVNSKYIGRPPIPIHSLSKEKSRSLNDVRAIENRQDQKPSADRMLTEADLKKVKRTFKISRSPSCDNVNIPRKLPDERALLDKMSKISTDGGSSSQIRRTEVHRRDSNKSTGFQNHKSRQDSTASISANVQMKNKLNTSHIGSLKKENQTIKISNSHEQNIQRNTTMTCKESVLPPSRKLSDSAYESNSTTSSNSSNSSPRIFRNDSCLKASELPARLHGDGLVGLRNLGNTCFMNSIIQCLRNTKKLREIFCSNYFVEDLNETTAPTKGRLAKAFSSVVKEMWMTSKSGLIVSPSNLKSQVQRYAPRFTGFSQQDSQEFLRFLLEGLHDDLNLVLEKGKYEYDCGNKLCDAEQARRAWNWYAKREKSVISDLFVGQLKSTLTCAECHHRSLTFDPFWDLSLPIPSRSRTSLISGKVSLYDCFKKFTQEEVLDGDEKPTCEMCKKRQKCFKRFSVERFPQILVIHLKRFSGLRYRTKLETLVDFPLELNLSSYAANDSIRKSEALYHLYGISNHSGGTYSGHYTAHCKHPDTNEWFYYSDSSVMKLSPGRIVTEEAYVLFYELSNQMSYL